MNSEKTNDNSFKSYIPHLKELKSRISKILFFILVIFIILFPFADEIYTRLAAPLIASLPSDSNMIAIDVASPFFIPFKLVLILSIFITIPFILYHLWRFIAPGLYEHEKKLIFPIILSSSILFYLGAAFAYFVVFPLIFAFFVSIAPEGIAVMTDIGRYLDFVVTLFFAFGFAFEVPIITIMLVYTNATTKERLIKKRPYVVVGAFIIGMLLTPPDVISQTLLAVPIWILYELGIFFSRFVNPKEHSEAKDELVDDLSAVENDNEKNDN
tara:strand:+ start:2734 stop:3543 length:810 start_codon:yes stop_codon:yes gene_type:complete